MFLNSIKLKIFVKIIMIIKVIIDKRYNNTTMYLKLIVLIFLLLIKSHLAKNNHNKIKKLFILIKKYSKVLIKIQKKTNNKKISKFS